MAFARSLDCPIATSRWSVDRLGRSLQHLLSFLAELKAKGIDLYLHQQGADTSTPAGKALFQMLGVFAEFERAMIVERVQAGLRGARGRKASVLGDRGCPSKSRERSARSWQRAVVFMRSRMLSA